MSRKPAAPNGTASRAEPNPSIAAQPRRLNSADVESAP
jgi:hypothetical protein